MEKRSGKDRRKNPDRRVLNDQKYKGPERRASDKRCSQRKMESSVESNNRLRIPSLCCIVRWIMQPRMIWRSTNPYRKNDLYQRERGFDDSR